MYSLTLVGHGGFDSRWGTCDTLATERLEISMVPIRTITVTLGRNRRPGSVIAPNEPLSDTNWATFQAEVLDLLVKSASTDDSWTEVHHGVGEWEGVREESAKVTILNAREVPMLGMLEALGDLAEIHDQDAVALATGTSVLLNSTVSV